MATRADPVTELLGTIDLFEGFDRKHLRLVREISREHVFQPGEAIVKQGATDTRFFLILEGMAEVSVDGRFARAVGPGGFFGEIAMLDGGPRTATITAATDVSALSIASFNMRALLKEHPEMAIKVLEALCGRVRAINGSVAHW
jgi:CRP/FNR family cyclic AMP-dependent transcriptional regulator